MIGTICDRRILVVAAVSCNIPLASISAEGALFRGEGTNHLWSAALSRAGVGKVTEKIFGCIKKKIKMQKQK